MVKENLTSKQRWPGVSHTESLSLASGRWLWQWQMGVQPSHLPCTLAGTEAEDPALPQR